VLASGVAGGGFVFARRRGAALGRGCANVAGTSVLVAAVSAGAVVFGRGGLLAGRLVAAFASAASGWGAVADGLVVAGAGRRGAIAAGCSLAPSDVLSCAGGTTTSPLAASGGLGAFDATRRHRTPTRAKLRRAMSIS
jgi:hypothetical protein